jgi:hypothetical protein
MPLKKILLKPGVNRENTRYTNESGWYDCDMIRFRQGTPEKIGGWLRISPNYFLGVCRSLWNWITLGALTLIGVGTNLKFYIEAGGAYNDITPWRLVKTLAANPFSTQINSTTVTVTDSAGGFFAGDFVTFANSTAVAGLTLNGEYQIKTVPTVSTYTITAASQASATTTGGGSSVKAYYQINVGSAITVPLSGWGAGPWGYGTWGFGGGTTSPLRLWSQNNFGEDLVFGYRGGAMYYWNATIGVKSSTMNVTIATPAVVTLQVALSNGDAVWFETTGELPTGLTPGTVYYVINVSGVTCNLSATYGGAAINTSGSQSGAHKLSSRGIPLTSLGGASDTPIIQNLSLISDTSRFIFTFGSNDYASITQDPMLVRWSDQESLTQWTPAATNQAGSLRLSHGSEIVAAIQSRQEILTWTDSSLYSFQYVGAPVVWSSQLVGDNISIAGQNAVAYSNGVSYWMGVDKFYKYDGRTQTLNCDLRQYVFSDINLAQKGQVYASTNEGFNEIWWFYCSAASDTIDRYVCFNYLENAGAGCWYYGAMTRTAWLDSGLRDYPIAATYDGTQGNLVNHEYGNDDGITGTLLPIESYITSAEFDIDDGHNFAFIWRVLPDMNFTGSSAASPQATMYLLPMQNSGSGYNVPPSVAGTNNAAITRTAVLPIEAFTGQINTRVRGRQLAMKVESTALGVQWQLGAPRLDIRPDGRR